MEDCRPAPQGPAFNAAVKKEHNRRTVYSTRIIIFSLSYIFYALSHFIPAGAETGRKWYIRHLLNTLKTTILLLLGGLLLSAAAYAQPHYFRHYQVENGLSHNTVFSTVQDRQGFLWVGTKDGLNRFDGYRFKTFPVISEGKEVLSTDLVLSLATDRQGTLWVGTQKGLYYFDAARERFHPFLDTVNGINDIYFDRQGQLWFIADNTLNRYHFGTRRLTTFPTDRFFNATSLCEATDGTMWFATVDGYLQQFNAASGTFTAHNVFRHSPPTESKSIQKIACDQRGRLLIGTNNQGIKEFDPRTLDYRDVLIHNPDQTTIYVRDILPVSATETWFATEAGVYIWNPATGAFHNLKKRFLDPYSLSDNAVYTLYRDTEGGIWAGTFFGGLNYYPRPGASFQKYFPDYSENSISGNAVREICAARDGTLWIGTEDAGLNRLDPRTGAITSFKPTGQPGSISYYNIHGLLVVNDDLWIGTFEHGLDIMDRRTGRVKKHYTAGPGAYSLKNNFVVSLLQTRSGTIYIGTGSGLYRYDPARDGFHYLQGVADGSMIPCLFEDHEGTVWIATHNRGIYYMNPRTGASGNLRHQPGNEAGLPSNSFNSIYEDSRRNLWLASDGGGLCRLDPTRQHVSRYNTLNGLPSNFVFKVLEDDSARLWVTTSKGLVQLDPASGKTTVYTKANGLLNDQFNYNSGYKDAEGNLYFGSVQGLIRFHPRAIRRHPVQTPVYITGLQVQNREVERRYDSSVLKESILYTRTITLPYHQSSFSLDFAAPRFTAPETTGYSYRMEGLDKEWTLLPSNRKVYFTNLEPGTYTFKVRAGYNGNWDEPRALTIVITPPFWATYWAYALYTLAALVLAYFGVRSYHRVQQSKKEKEIYQAKMEFFTNIAHEIKTPLTLIKGPVENLGELAGDLPAITAEVQTMERNTDRLIQLVNQILDFRQTETRGFSLDFADVHLATVLEEAFETFRPLAVKRGLDYTLHLPAANVVTAADAEALTKVFNNLLSNAVKYARAEVRVQLLPPGEAGLRVEVSNDGFLIPPELKEKIFEPFYRIKDTRKQKGTGLGLALARSLVELHNGRLYVREGTSDRNIFVVELPFTTLSKNRKAPAPPGAPYSHR